MRTKLWMGTVLVAISLMIGSVSCQKMMATTPKMPAIPTPTSTSLVTLTNTPQATVAIPTATPTVTGSPAPVAALTSTPTTTSSVTPAPTIPPTGIYFQGTYYYDPQNAFGQASLYLSVNGTPETTDPVTLFTPTGNVSLTYAGTYGATAYYFSGNVHLPYVPGSPYTMIAQTSLGQAAATVAAPGGNEAVTPDGLTASWSHEGNADQVTVATNGNWAFQSPTPGDVDSPFSIPVTTYNQTAAYYVRLNLNNTTTNVVGADPGAFFSVMDSTVYTFYK